MQRMYTDSSQEEDADRLTSEEIAAQQRRVRGSVLPEGLYDSETAAVESRV